MNVPSFLTLHINWPWVSIIAPIWCRRKLLWWRVIQTPIHECIRISLRVISSFSSFSRTIILVSPTSYLVSGSWLLEQCATWVPVGGLGLKPNQIVFSGFHNFGATITPTYITGGSPLEIEGLVSGLVFTVLLW